MPVGTGKKFEITRVIAVDCNFTLHPAPPPPNTPTTPTHTPPRPVQILRNKDTRAAYDAELGKAHDNKFKLPTETP